MNSGQMGNMNEIPKTFDAEESNILFICPTEIKESYLPMDLIFACGPYMLSDAVTFYPQV